MDSPEQLPASYTDNGDGTVTDTSTGLMWQQAGSVQAWWLALGYCEELNLGGYTDWRLPTIKELRSLVDYSRHSPSINTTYFPDVALGSRWYWSSTTADSNGDAWGMDFSNGLDGVYYKFNGSTYARAVRGGQPGPLDHSVLSVSPATRNVAKNAGSTAFDVSNTGTGTMSWTASVTSGGSWLSIASGASGSNSGTITCNYSDNTTTSSRTATLRITASGATSSPMDVTVTQTLTPLEVSTLLWAGSDGSASIWNMDTSGNMATYMLYGPFIGWTAKNYNKNSDGTAQMLWVRTDGYTSLWNMDTSGNMTTYMLYGPYPGWAAQDYD